MLTERYGRRDDYICVAIDSSSAYNACSHHKMLELHSIRAPTFAHFINMVYGRSPPFLVLPANRSHTLQSREGIQQGDPASMLHFAITIHPLLLRITRERRVTLDRWYADDDTPFCPIDEVGSALRLLTAEGHLYDFHLNAIQLPLPHTKSLSWHEYYYSRRSRWEM